MLEKTINEAVKDALKQGDKVKVSSLRMLISAIKNRKIADRVEELEDEKVGAIVLKMVKQHKESIEKFHEGGREDLVEKETVEMAVLEEYLPEQMSEEELTGIISEAIQTTGASSPGDMGKVMGAVMGRTKGKADGSLISRMVNERLKSL